MHLSVDEFEKSNSEFQMAFSNIQNDVEFLMKK